MSASVCSFDSAAHAYAIDGRPVPSVTKALSILPHFEADTWYLDRGTVVHACAALIARGRDFDFAPEVAGQVEACRRWFRDFRPDVFHVERQVYSRVYGFAGTCDLICQHGGRLVLVDWKASLDKRVQWQLGGYALGAKESLRVDVGLGFGVELHEDGSYTTGEVYELRRAGREFLSILGTYKCMEREGLL